MKEILDLVRSGQSLDQAQMTLIMREIMDGKCEDAQIIDFLNALSARGETVEEISGAATVMREKALKINAPENAVDCCGTGGDGAGTYNISTAVAIIAAACGVPMAKHGNRASSSKSGAADVLEALGVNLDCPQERLEEALRRYNFAFLMAPRHHSAMKHVMPARKAIGKRTIFNLLGPLANPAQTRFQLLGVYDRKWLLPFAQTLKALGTTRAWIVCGADGLDEITVTGETYVAVLDNGTITQKTLTPEDFGLERSAIQDLKGGDAKQNAEALAALLDGAKGAYRNIVLCNCAAVLMIANTSPDLKSAASLAREAIDSGKARAILDQYIKFTNEGHAPI